MNHDQQLAHYRAKQLAANLEMLEAEYSRWRWSEQRQKERIRVVTTNAGENVLLEAGHTELVWGLLEMQ